MDAIDFVVTWLDSTDPVWQEQYESYRQNSKGDTSKARFRNMDIFRYWFRAVENYAPWVNKIYLISNGKFPDWINKNNPKLIFVKHEDYIPREVLPTFNSCTTELPLHKIVGLSEHFVYFNDDMFLNAPVSPEYYFKKGLPCDCNKETPFNVPIYTNIEKFNIYMSMLSDIGIVNGHFNRWDTVKQSPWRWFGPHLGIKGLLMSCMLMKQRLFVGFSNFHIEQAYLKSTFEELWEKENDFMLSSCTRFREEVIANPYVFRYWQFAKNQFYPKKRRFGTVHLIEREDIHHVEEVIFDKNNISICLNDTPLISEDDFHYIKSRIQEFMRRKYPMKSSFEI